MESDTEDEAKAAAAIEVVAQLLALIADRDATIERYERLLSEKSAQLESGISALRAEALAMLPLARAQQEAIERVRALLDLDYWDSVQRAAIKKALGDE